jgi:hypothetical protein
VKDSKPSPSLDDLPMLIREGVEPGDIIRISPPPPRAPATPTPTDGVEQKK